MLDFKLPKIVDEELTFPFLKEKEVSVFVRREDKIHSYISGNKYRKLKYNLLAAQEKRVDTLLTFGGAFSNHIAAVASAGKEFGFNTIGIIRGDELEAKILENPTLSFAKQCGMQFKFVSRSDYRQKEKLDFIQLLRDEFGSFYLIPEGGTNALGVKGCEEILTKKDKDFDVICVSAGTGGTISGIINSSLENQQVLGFSALKGDFLTAEIIKFVSKTNWKVINDYHFGGYAKVKPTLLTFMNNFTQKTNIPLDPVYTAKLFFGLFKMIKTNYFAKGTKILAIHTGGLQGVLGMNEKLKRQKM